MRGGRVHALTAPWLVACAVSALISGRASAASTTPAAPDWTSSAAHAARRDVDRFGWYVPDFAKLQTGGFAGLFSVGTGYAAFDDILNVSLLYGYVPEWHAEVSVHSLHLTAAGRPFDFELRPLRVVPIYLGAGLLHTWGEDYFVRLPERYASGYYPPTGLHWTAHIGTEIDYVPRGGLFERHGVYAELTTVDTLFFAYVENRATLGVVDAVGLGFGYRAAF